jgi:hypothetical protein
MKRAAMNINAQVQLVMMRTMAKNCDLHDFIPKIFLSFA